MLQHFINGHRTAGTQSSTFDVLNPDDDSILDQCVAASTQDIRNAVEAAQQAFGASQKCSAAERQNLLLAVAEQLRQHRRIFEAVLIRETGSPVAKAEREIETSIRLLQSAAAVPKQIRGQTFSSDDSQRASFSVREPLGVVAAFTPFNVPLIKSAKIAAMALATGNTLVLMPSEKTPGVSLLLAKLFHEAGLTPGAFNVVCGIGTDVGDQLTTSPEVRCVSFTGSTAVGKHVATLCGLHRKRVTLEMGGQNPLIVLADANVPIAIQAAIPGSFLFQGQICMASSRIILHESIAEAFLNGFSNVAGKLQAGDLSDAKTMIGPIIDAPSRKRLRDLIDDALQQGANLMCGNEWNDNRLMPTILTDVTRDMKIWQKEIFGPVAVVTTVRDSNEAIAVANDSDFGLCASVFTDNLDDAMRFTRQLNYGMVHVNEGTILEEAEVPFGGVKDSGFGREGTMAAIDEFTEWKWITMRSIP